MRKIRIFQNHDLSPDEVIQLDEGASRHLAQVLRLATGDEVILFNGDGGDYLARIEAIDKKKTTVSIQNKFENTTESRLDVHLFQGISKGDRMDTAIQKSVELGIKSFTPMVCERTVVRTSKERNDKKLQHWENIIINACEQSGRAFIPDLSPVMNYEDALHCLTPVQSILLHPDQEQSISQIELDNQRINILIGPEGGFSDREFELANKHGFKLVSMGKRILRTETAPIAAIAVLQSRFGDY
jgi:16S rRNA (uracil1498-N3)-methyltransferase